MQVQVTVNVHMRANTHVCVRVQVQVHLLLGVRACMCVRASVRVADASVRVLDDEGWRDQESEFVRHSPGGEILTADFNDCS